MDDILYAYRDGMITKYTARLAQVPDGREVNEYRLARSGTCTHAAEIKEGPTMTKKSYAKVAPPNEEEL